MIMVEGKLQSWGRAETVLKILDIDVAGKKLEATLEDIVEAVYNCGDRQSSLVYLQQECQCCFTYFPMSKVRVLFMNISIHAILLHINFWHCPQAAYDLLLEILRTPLCIIHCLNSIPIMLSLKISLNCLLFFLQIRTLNCPCKICFDCMKNYFELNIREKHVRNLCCPICQHPNMDNTEAANEYLSFLTMLVSLGFYIV